MKGLFIINPSSGKQNIESMLKDIMATLILDQVKMMPKIVLPN